MDLRTTPIPTPVVHVAYEDGGVRPLGGHREIA